MDEKKSKMKKKKIMTKKKRYKRNNETNVNKKIKKNCLSNFSQPINLLI